MYECIRPEDESFTYKFELIIEEIDIDAVCAEAVSQELNSVVGEEVVIECGPESTEHDDRIDWAKDDGVILLLPFYL